MLIDPQWFTREHIEKHSVDMRQFIDFRQSTLPNGSRIIEVYNSSGLAFSLLPDRGLDIWTAHFHGVPLTWIGQGSPHPPDEGQSWLRQFNGGLLTTCGLTHAGPPETDSITGEQRDLHGRYSRLRAAQIAAHGAWVGGEYVLELSGVITQSALFGEQLRLERTIRVILGVPTIEIMDRVTNLSDEPAPLMVLYHVNLGYPLVRAGTELHTAYEAVYPRDEAARAGLDRWPYYYTAVPNYAEQVFFHHVKADDNGHTRAALLQESWGLQFIWDANTLPYLTQWKNIRQGIYVCGIEPGNCIPEGRNAARASGRLVMLQPGEVQRFSLALALLDGPGLMQRVRDRIAAARENDQPVTGCQLGDYAESGQAEPHDE